MTDPWFPDYIAQWYDDFCEKEPYADIERWMNIGAPFIKTWIPGLENNPHVFAKRLDDFIKNGTFPAKTDERRFHALRIASEVFETMGFRFRKLYGNEAWKEIRKHWQTTGNLLKRGEGHLLPMEPLSYVWAWNRFVPNHTVELYFKNFVRWNPSKHPKHNIRVTVLPDHLISSVDRLLRVGVVPLVESMGDFHVNFDDSDPVNPIFSMTLRSPDDIEIAALRALESSAAQEFDIVVFPELCLTPQIQESLRKRLRLLGARPWLVVAGSARTPSRLGTGSHYNQSLLFIQGRHVLSHHKQYRYEMDIFQQERYGVLDALEEVNRVEDMEVLPYEIEVLDTPVGRIATLICEDLSVESLVEPLIVKLGVDWLFVPVLDGCQMSTRWTAKHAQRYAEKGACVIVATSLSLVKQHLLTLRPGTPSGAGLVAYPTTSGPKERILVSNQHYEPTFVDLPFS